jgi:hypothetical protein
LGNFIYKPLSRGGCYDSKSTPEAELKGTYFEISTLEVELKGAYFEISAHGGEVDGQLC